MMRDGGSMEAIAGAALPVNLRSANCPEPRGNINTARVKLNQSLSSYNYVLVAAEAWTTTFSRAYIYIASLPRPSF